MSIEPQQAQVAVAVPTPAETMSSGIDVAAAAKRADTWQAQLRQSTEPEKRSAVWMEVRQALRSVDKTALLAALQTVILTRDLAVDRTGLHDTLLAAIESTESPIRLAAWQALINTGIQPSDVDKLRTQVLDAPRSDRSEMLLRLNWATRGDLNGPSADVALRCMSNAEDVKGTIRALQNAKLTDAIVARVVGYARTSVEAAQSAQHFVLNNLRDKNHEVVVFLLERANAGDSTAIFGLSQGMATRLRTV